MLKYVALFCLLSKLLIAQNYFIHLTESGLNQKSHFLDNSFNKISGIKNINFSKSPDLRFLPAAPFEKYSNPFDKWLVLQSSQTKEIIDDLIENDLIDYYEQVGRFKIDFESNDSLSSQQWYLDKINVTDAWKITKGSPDIIIGIIDTGIDFLHPDLQQAIWVNSAEDLNGNGLLDEQDINHLSSIFR